MRYLLPPQPCQAPNIDSQQTMLAQIVMAALVVVLAFFFMPASENAETPFMRVSMVTAWPATHLRKLNHCIAMLTFLRRRQRLCPRWTSPYDRRADTCLVFAGVTAELCLDGGASRPSPCCACSAVQQRVAAASGARGAGVLLRDSMQDAVLEQPGVPHPGAQTTHSAHALVLSSPDATGLHTNLCSAGRAAESSWVL